MRPLSGRGGADARVARVRDDRVLPLTRWVARIVVPVLVAASLVLYGFPGRTTELFAWTIRPDMTPLLMGAGYGAGVYFFARVATATEWHRVAPVFLGIATFTWAMALATVLHWENFNHAHYTFALWVVLYAVTPLLVPWVWLRNRRTDPGIPVDGVPVGDGYPRAVRALTGAVGVSVALVAVACFLAPGLLMGVWPWTVSPLTTRILAGWFALLGVVNVAAAFEPRWSGVRILIQSQLLGFALVLVGVARTWGDFDAASPLTYGVVGGMVLYLCAVAALYVVVERRHGRV